MDSEIIKSREGLKGKKGITLVFLAIVITVLLGFVALAIDVGHLMATRNELQNVADSAALAGAGYLGSVYKESSYSQQQGYTFTRDEIVSVVQNVSEKNKASGDSVSINNNEDIIIGLWNSDSKEVEPTLISPDAVYVKTRRDDSPGSANSPISTFFARIFGIDTMNVSAEATAALTGPAWVDVGELKTPFSLSQQVFPNDCTDEIRFHPKGECAGWHNFFDHHSASNMKEKMLGLIEGHDSCEDCDGLILGSAWLQGNFEIKKNQYPDAMETPKTSAGDTFNHIGGPVGALFLGGVLPDSYDGNTYDKENDSIIGDETNPAPFPTLFDYFRYRDGDGDDEKWTATVPVYKEEGECQNPHGALEIIGFATIEVFRPNPPPDKTIDVFVYCDISVIEGRGGGGTYGGLRGTIPNLVQ